MFPVVGTGTTRVNPRKDVILGNGKLRVPRGTIVWIGQHALMNCQANWSEPDRFIPERWAQVRMTWEACRHTPWQGDRAHVYRHWQVQQHVTGFSRGSSRKKEKDHLLLTGLGMCELPTTWGCIQSSLVTLSMPVPCYTGWRRVYRWQGEPRRVRCY